MTTDEIQILSAYILLPNDLESNMRICELIFELRTVTLEIISRIEDFRKNNSLTHDDLRTTLKPRLLN